MPVIDGRPAVPQCDAPSSTDGRTLVPHCSTAAGVERAPGGIARFLRGAGAQGWVRTQAERKLATLRACGAPGGSQEELARALRRHVRLIMNTGA